MLLFNSFLAQVKKGGMTSFDSAAFDPEFKFPSEERGRSRCEHTCKCLWQDVGSLSSELPPKFSQQH